MAKPVLFLSGASGHFGGSFLGQAEALGIYDVYDVRAGTSSPAKIDDLKKKYPKIEWVLANLEDDAQVDAAFSGVDTLFVIPGGVENRGELATKAVRHAKKQGVRRVLLFSVAGAEYKSILFARQFRLAEEELEGSGLVWNHLRTIWFQENVFGWAAPIKQGLFPIATGEGKYAPMNLADAAQAAAVILLRRDGSLDNRAFVISGPELLSSADQAAIISKALGREVKFVSPSPEDQKAALLGAGWPEWQATGALELLDLFKNNGAAFVSPDFKTLTGKEGTKFADWFETVKGAFQ
eukprot:TRINITY_DN496_c0_g1_i1.p1 TRINITY_DN496_c0_g1~~TRINITY_DN496_c0_g1_i1.p1  ORF type:complete len:295 (+),score=99.08 TRINITY_DN496_c0_g1_i1:112-996(+)